jgi:quercetin dioxygenase-like cupin family protein
MNLRETLKFTDEKPAVLQIRNTDKTQILTIGLKKGQVLKKHVSSIPALLIVLEGIISFEMEEDIMNIEALSTFEIPVNIAHSVTGIEESIFLVIKEKGGTV